MSDKKTIIYTLAAIAGSQWMWLWDAIRCGDPDRYRYGLQDIVMAVLFVIITWSFPAVKEIIGRAVSKW